MLKVHLNSENAKKTFGKSHASDFGYDLGVDIEVHIPPMSSMLIPTGVRVQIPEGYGGLIIGRSSTNTRHNLTVITGVIDSGYRGELLINVYNNSSHHIKKVKERQRLAQLIVQPMYTGEVSFTSTLSDSNRGDNGFGSTGG